MPEFGGGMRLGPRPSVEGTELLCMYVWLFVFVTLQNYICNPASKSEIEQEKQQQ